MPALLNLQPSGALLLGGLVLLVAGLVLLWLARAHMPSDAVQHPYTPLPVPQMLTLTPLLVEDPIVVTQPAPVFEAPRCYDTPTDHLMCLGLLKNATNHLWKNISLTASLSHLSQRVTLEQTYLLPGDSAPYRVLWSNGYEEEAELVIGAPQAQLVSDPVIEIPVQGMEGRWLGETRYQVRGMLQNPTDKTLNQGQIIVTLFGANDAVIGYRLSDLSPLEPQSSVPFEVDLTPIVYDDRLTPQVSILAWTN